MTVRSFFLGLVWTGLVVIGMIAVITAFDLSGFASGAVGIVAGCLVISYGPVAVARRW